MTAGEVAASFSKCPIQHAAILQMHGPTKDAAFACLIVIGFHLNPV